MSGPSAPMRLACNGWLRPLRQSEHDLDETTVVLRLQGKPGLLVSICHPSLLTKGAEPPESLPHSQKTLSRPWLTLGRGWKPIAGFALSSGQRLGKAHALTMATRTAADHRKMVDCGQSPA